MSVSVDAGNLGISLDEVDGEFSLEVVDWVLPVDDGAGELLSLSQGVFGSLPVVDSLLPVEDGAGVL